MVCTAPTFAATMRNRTAMNTTETLKQAFAAALGVGQDFDVEKMRYGAVEQWDSTAHMALIAEIEGAFDILLSTDDVIDLSSFEKAKEIVTKYGVPVEA